jgi:hypothetical protein
MAKTAVREEEAFELGALIALLSDSYTASYRGSSLKVRRRYRRLIVALTKAKAELDIAAELQPHAQAYQAGRRDRGD